MLIAFALGATQPQPEHTLDGVYGEFPYLPGSPAVRLDGHRVHINLGQDHGPVREGQVQVDPEHHLLTLTDAERSYQYTYDVLNGVLVLGVLVREGDRWITRHGTNPNAPCTLDNACFDWDGSTETEAFGRTVRLSKEQRLQSTVVMAWSQPVGPVGRIPAADQTGLAGRWWAEGKPGTRITQDGVLLGWSESMGAFPGERSVGVTTGTYWVHGPMGHGDGVGHMLWFLTTDGRLFVHDRPPQCRVVSQGWAVFERVP